MDIFRQSAWHSVHYCVQCIPCLLLLDTKNIFFGECSHFIPQIPMNKKCRHSNFSKFKRNKFDFLPE